MIRPAVLVLPRDVVVSPLCTLVGTLGRLELESVAAVLVLYLQAHSPDAWAPVTRRQIADWMRQSPQVKKMASNPFWRLDVHGFIMGGWIAGWDAPGRESADDPGTVTERFLRAIGGGK